MFENARSFKYTLAGRPLVIETGKLSQLSNGSCLVRYGDTVILANATASAAPRDGIDFLPLSVDFEERLYAVGKIPGSFLKREGRPSEKAILASRVIDRPIRPLFPKDMRNDVGVVATVMSVDPDCSPEITAMIGVSVALSISEIPWDGPISGVSVGLVDGKFVINPTEAQREVSQMAVTVASTSDLVAMIEAGANEVSNDDMYDGIMYAHKVNQDIVKFIKGIQKEVGKEKIDFPSNDPSHEMFEAIKEFAIDDVKFALDTDDKRIRDERLRPIYEAVHAKFDEEYPEEIAKIDDCMYKLQKFIVRRWLLDEGKRVDGRGLDDMRPLDAQIDLLSRVHGSGMFTRGQTQVLTVTTLGTIGESQELDGIDKSKNPILLLGATNVPWLVDEAFLRPGRFDVKVYVGLPDFDARRQMLITSFAAGNVPHEPGLTAHMAERTEGFSGADLCGVMARMRQIAFDRRLSQYTYVLADEILELASPTTSDELVRRIRDWESA